MSRQPSLIYEVCARFDALKAPGVSRHEEKRRLRREAAARGHSLPPVALSTGRIHADKTLDDYKACALRYAHYARETQGVRRLAELDAQAPQLVSLYLAACAARGLSPASLKTYRAALRMLHRPAYPQEVREPRVRALGAAVPIPPRRREEITRSRRTVAMDRDIALHRYAALIAFAQATGLRRRELAALLVADVQQTADGRLFILVRNGKGGKHRAAPVLAGHDERVRRVIAGRPAGERVFPRILGRLDVQSYRRAYAQDLYCEDGRRPLPPAHGRLTPGSVDVERALLVSRALGHDRLDVTLRHYLR